MLIGRYLIHDLTTVPQPAGGGSFGTVDNSVSADDHLGVSRRFVPLPSQLRCGGSGVTHIAASGNVTVPALSTVRYSIRAPVDPTITQWSVRVSVLTMPVAATGAAPYTTWPNNGNITLNQGRAFVFVKNFARRIAPAITACGALTPVESCTLPSGPSRECFLERELRGCPVVGASAMTILPDGRIGIGGRGAVVVVSANFSSSGMTSATATVGDARLLAPVPHPSTVGETVLLFCGVGDGRPWCEYRSTANLTTVSGTSQWLATGVIPRSATAQYGVLLTGGSVYTGHYQLAVPDNTAVDSNVITRSLLSNTASWVYRYTLQGSVSNNGL